MAKPLPDPGIPWPVSMTAVGMIADFEGLRLKAYRCPAGVPTIGWGETDGVQMGDTCTKEQADRWLCEDLTDRVKAIKAMCTEHANENQLGAMLSLAYNIGLRDDKRKAGLYYSTVLRCHNERKFEAASRAFSLFNMARDPSTGQLRVLPQLTARRAAEAALYLRPEDDELHVPAAGVMPQEVQTETSLAKSPIAQGGALTTGLGGVITVAGALGDQISPVMTHIKEFADQLSVQPIYLAGGALIVVGLVVMHQRLKQRREGWA
jgi:lysozyme